MKGDALLVQVVWAHQMNKVYLAFDQERILVMACENYMWNVVNCIFIKSEHLKLKYNKREITQNQNHNQNHSNNHNQSTKMKIHSLLINNQQLYVAASNNLLLIHNPYA